MPFLSLTIYPLQSGLYARIHDNRHQSSWIELHSIANIIISYNVLSEFAAVTVTSHDQDCMISLAIYIYRGIFREQDSSI